jgi:hypothetical protein
MGKNAAKITELGEVINQNAWKLFYIPSYFMWKRLIFMRLRSKSQFFLAKKIFLLPILRLRGAWQGNWFDFFEKSIFSFLLAAFLAMGLAANP